MSPKTMSEKILSIKSGRNLYHGDVAVCNIDAAMGTDGSVPMALKFRFLHSGNAHQSNGHA
jgi:3-isopropylmalate/(R)-2-methylmalate dehydratase large subunit